jgi:hypothetical protein
VFGSRWERWGPVAGVVFVVLFIVGLTLNNIPSGDDSAAKITSFYNDGGDRAQVIISSYVLWLAGLFFLWFIASLRTRLFAVEGVPGRLSLIAFGGGLVFIAMLMAAAAAFASVAGAITFGGEDFGGAEGARYLPELGYPFLLVAAPIAAIALVDAASVLIVRTKMMPAWIGYFGFVAAVALLFSGLFFPILLFLLWIVFVSVAMWRTPETAAEGTPAPAASPMA